MNTRARIATICQANSFFPTVEENRAHVLTKLELALSQRPDLVCLPENFSTVTLPNSAAEKAEALTGPTIEMVAARARRNACYIICPLLLRKDDGGIVNAAVVVGRAGEVVGVYEKRRPVTSSADYTVLERGIVPGTSDGVFDLDFGRIGIRICFDAVFPEEWESLAAQDVRMVFWASAYDGGRTLAAYALQHHYYVVTSVRTQRSRIIDPCGTTLEQTNPPVTVAVRDINLDFAVCHYDFNFGIPERILADYPDRVEIRSHFEDGIFLVEPTDPEITTADLQAEYGFETLDSYRARNRDAHLFQHRGEELMSQVAAHGNRAIYGSGKD